LSLEFSGWTLATIERELSELKQVSDELDRGGCLSADDRGAYFQCVVCLTWPDMETQMFEGTVDGQLARSAVDAGSSTFAHCLVPDGERTTLVRLDAERRRAYCHYQRAIRLLRLSVV